MRLTNKTCIDTAYLRQIAYRVFALIRETEDQDIVDNIRKWTMIRVEYSPKNIFHGKAFLKEFRVKVFVPGNIWLISSYQGSATIAYTLHHEIMHLFGYQHGDRYRNGDRMGSTWRAFHMEKWMGMVKEMRKIS